MKNKNILVLSVSLLFTPSSQACGLVGYLLSFVQSHIPFLKKKDLQVKQATPDELSKEREELKKIAAAENNKVKRKILEQMYKRAEPTIRYNTHFLEHYHLANKEDVRHALIGDTYKRVFEDSFEVENDADRSQILSFFNIDDTQKAEAAQNPSCAYASIFAKFKGQSEEPKYVVMHSHSSLLPCRQFCKEQLNKISLSLNDGPTIAASTYALCMALYNFRHTNNAMAHTQGYKNAHQDLALTAFACVSKSDFKSFVSDKLMKLSVDKAMLKEAGFDV